MKSLLRFLPGRLPAAKTVEKVSRKDRLQQAQDRINQAHKSLQDVAEGLANDDMELADLINKT